MVARSIMTTEPKKVPLVIYINHERKVIGEAIVRGDEIQCRITEEGTELAALVTKGVGVDGLSGDFSFSMPDVAWEERYPSVFEKPESRFIKRHGE
jgi:hypothetical protein